MKEETKKKLCKISKILGFAITFGFAVFGVLCAAMLIANGSGKKDDIKTLDTSLVQNEVRSERNIKPRKAVNPEDNLLNNYTFELSSNEWNYYDTSNNARFIWNTGYHSLVWNSDDMPSGYYRLSGSMPLLNFPAGFWVTQASVNAIRGIAPEQPVFLSTNNYRLLFNLDNQDKYNYYFYLDWGSVSFPYFMLNCSTSSDLYLELVDTIKIPASSSVYLGENWNPLKVFGDNLSPKGGYLILNQNWTYGTYTNPTIRLDGLLFKYEGHVFDRITIGLKPLNATHSPYVDSSGNIVNPSDNSGTQEIYVLSFVSFSQSWNRVADLGNGVYVTYSVPVLSAGKADTPVGGKYPYNGSVIWSSESRTIQIIEDKGTTGERFDNRFLGMTDLDLVKFLSQYQSEGIDVVNTAGMFSLFNNAFSSLLPILSVSILPNITLGMLLFIPLVGGIIVVIIRLVKK